MTRPTSGQTAIEALRAAARQLSATSFSFAGDRLSMARRIEAAVSAIVAEGLHRPAPGALISNGVLIGADHRYRTITI